MADILINPRRPEPPDASGAFWGEPVRGEHLLTLTSCADHLLASRAMACAWLDLDYSRDPAAGHGGDLLKMDPAGVNQDVLVPWTQSPLATHVLVWVHLQAYTLSGKTSSPVVDLTLRTVTGAAIDSPLGGAGTRADDTAGTMGGGRGWEVAAHNLGVPIIGYPIRSVAFVHVAPTPPAGAYPTEPRALAYGGAAGLSQRVELRIQTTDARLVRVDVAELPRAMVTQ